MRIQKMKKFIAIMAGLLLTVATNYAQVAPQQAPTPKQTEIKAEKLENFIAASKDISLLQQESEQKMLKTLETQNLDVETFQKIAAMQYNPEQPKSAEVTSEQLESFKKLMPQFQEMQMEMQKNMVKAIENRQLKINEYQEIAMAYQTDANLQKRINEMMAE
jgi:hypothetical protein